MRIQETFKFWNLVRLIQEVLRYVICCDNVNTFYYILWLTHCGLKQNGRHFADAILNCIFLNENVWIALKFSLTFVPKVPIGNSPSLVQIMAWSRPGGKPLSEPVVVSLPSLSFNESPQRVFVNHFAAGSGIICAHKASNALHLPGHQHLWY